MSPVPARPRPTAASRHATRASKACRSGLRGSGPPSGPTTRSAAVLACRTSRSHSPVSRSQVNSPRVCAPTSRSRSPAASRASARSSSVRSGARAPRSSSTFRRRSARSTDPPSTISARASSVVCKRAGQALPRPDEQQRRRQLQATAGDGVGEAGDGGEAAGGAGVAAGLPHRQPGGVVQQVGGAAGPVRGRVDEPEVAQVHPLQLRRRVRQDPEPLDLQTRRARACRGPLRARRAARAPRRRPPPRTATGLTSSLELVFDKSLSVRSDSSRPRAADVDDGAAVDDGIARDRALTAEAQRQSPAVALPGDVVPLPEQARETRPARPPPPRRGRRPRHLERRAAGRPRRTAARGRPARRSCWCPLRGAPQPGKRDDPPPEGRGVVIETSCSDAPVALLFAPAAPSPALIRAGRSAPASLPGSPW